MGGNGSARRAVASKRKRYAAQGYSHIRMSAILQKVSFRLESTEAAPFDLRRPVNSPGSLICVFRCLLDATNVDRRANTDGSSEQTELIHDRN